MGYTHFDQVSGINGVGVGSKDNEIVVADASGFLFQVGTQIQVDADKINSGAQSKTVLFTENGAGTYTGTIAVDAGATILDIIIHAVAVWDAAVSAVMIVGDAADPDGFFVSTDMRATDLTVGQSINFSHTGAREGAYIPTAAFQHANSHITPRYTAAARSIIGVITSTGAGTAGRTLMTVVYSRYSPLNAVKT